MEGPKAKKSPSSERGLAPPLSVPQDQPPTHRTDPDDLLRGTNAGGNPMPRHVPRTFAPESSRGGELAKGRLPILRDSAGFRGSVWISLMARTPDHGLKVLGHGSGGRDQGILIPESGVGSRGSARGERAGLYRTEAVPEFAFERVSLVFSQVALLPQNSTTETSGTNVTSV